MLNSLDTEGRPQDTRVVVAMSGGVDSSVTAALLKAQGYDVVGVTLQLYDHGAATHRKGACCAGRDIHDARAVAERIGIPHYVLDYEARFKEAVIDRFADSYAAGETPVPCIECNRSIKFADLLGTARELGAQVLATGHYVVNRRLRRRQPGALSRARKRARPELFPVRHHARAARRAALSARRPAQAAGARARARSTASRSPTSRTARTSASCRPGRYADIIARLKPDAAAPGDIVDLAGKVLGRHDGIIHFTVGQRKGLKIAARRAAVRGAARGGHAPRRGRPARRAGDPHDPPARRELDRRRRARRAGAPRGVRQGALDAPAARRMAQRDGATASRSNSPTARKASRRGRPACSTMRRRRRAHARRRLHPQRSRRRSEKPDTEIVRRRLGFLPARHELLAGESRLRQRREPGHQLIHGVGDILRGAWHCRRNNRLPGRRLRPDRCPATSRHIPC